VDGLGAGALFRTETLHLHDRFISLIASYLDGAVAEGAIPPIETTVAATAWFGALHELVMGWLVADRPAPLEQSGVALRGMLLRSVGVPEQRIASLAAAGR
jgi:hypothetical protein